MAKRPVFLPCKEGIPLVRVTEVEFTWYPGMAKSQKQKSIQSLHEAARRKFGIGKILEISSKSEDHLGVQLSAFHLSMTVQSRRVPVECVFQGSKVFEHDGPYTDLYEKSPQEAKKDPRLWGSGPLRGFVFEGIEWPLEPKTAFYDWLYIRALKENPALAEALLDYEAFTDIEFNPKKSFNCQAYSATLYKALRERDMLEEVLSSPENFRQAFSRIYGSPRERPLPGMEDYLSKKRKRK